MTTKAPTAGDAMLHPFAAASLALLALNDHVFKERFGNVVTGKLSDVAGMIFFPLLLVSLHELVLRARGRFVAPSRRAVVVSVVATGAVFAAVKLSHDAALVWRLALAALQWPVRALLAGRAVELSPVAHVVDPTDLLALPFLAVPLFVGARRARARTAARAEDAVVGQR